MRLVYSTYAWLLDSLCRISGHRLCHTWVGRQSYEYYSKSI